MHTTRRTFLGYSLGAGALLAARGLAAARAQQAAPATASAKKKILVLGGTRFLGPAIVNAALARGHEVTLFNRGRFDPEIFKAIETLIGNRDPKKDEGLKALEGDRRWDAVIDTSGYVPRVVRASAELLAPRVEHYAFISSVSVYPTHAEPNADESEAVATMPDPTVEVMGANSENYGPLKALCEQAAEAALPGKVANVRPGYIVGPRDPTPRWTYWPGRVARGGAMLAPGNPTDPIQIIDVRDLGEWMVKLAEDRTAGVFNALGPAQPIAMKEMLDACKAGTGGEASYTWVPASFLREHAVELPIWIDPVGEYAGFHRRSNARAVKAGLTFRPVSDTARATHEWLATLPEKERATLTGALPAAREAELLAAWSAKQPK